MGCSIERSQPTGLYDGQGKRIPLDAPGIVSFEGWLPQERGALAVSIIGCAKIRDVDGTPLRDLNEIKNLFFVGSDVAEYHRLSPLYLPSK